MVNKIVLNLQGFTSEWDLHEYMQKCFNIPEYYGHNVSALWDAVYLWLDEPTVIEVRNLDKLPANMKTVGEWVRSVFQDLDREAPRVEVVFRP